MTLQELMQMTQEVTDKYHPMQREDRCHVTSRDATVGIECTLCLTGDGNISEKETSVRLSFVVVPSASRSASEVNS